jgi:hypothetical protein
MLSGVYPFVLSILSIDGEYSHVLLSSRIRGTLNTGQRSGIWMSDLFNVFSIPAFFARCLELDNIISVASSFQVLSLLLVSRILAPQRLHWSFFPDSKLFRMLKEKALRHLDLLQVTHVLCIPFSSLILNIILPLCVFEHTTEQN